jgi:hypothetical protein
MWKGNVQLNIITESTLSSRTASSRTACILALLMLPWPNHCHGNGRDPSSPHTHDSSAKSCRHMPCMRLVLHAESAFRKRRWNLRWQRARERRTLFKCVHSNCACASIGINTTHTDTYTHTLCLCVYKCCKCVCYTCVCHMSWSSGKL